MSYGYHRLADIIRKETGWVDLLVCIAEKGFPVIPKEKVDIFNVYFNLTFIFKLLFFNSFKNPYEFAI